MIEVNGIIVLSNTLKAKVQGLLTSKEHQTINDENIASSEEMKRNGKQQTPRHYASAGLSSEPPSESVGDHDRRFSS
jgi:hypothetical protein